MTKAEQDKAEFMRMFRGIDARDVARAVSNLTPGVDWTHCSKGYIADSWSRRDETDHHDRLHLVTLQLIVSEMKRLGRWPKMLCACATCGCTDIQCTAWIEINTSVVQSCEGPTDQIWCPQCGEETSMVEARKPKPYNPEGANA